MKRFKALGLVVLLFFLTNYERSQNETVINTHVNKDLTFHHFNLTEFTFMHSSDWHYSIHKTNSNILKVLNNPVPVNFHFITGDLVDSKSKDGISSHQYEFEQNQVEHIIGSYTEKYNQLFPDFNGFFSVVGNHDIYDSMERQKLRQHHIIDTNTVKLVMLDTGPFGLGRPLNFFGFIDDLVLEIIEMSLADNKPIIIMAHYPLSTTFYSKRLLLLLSNYHLPVYYLCGHLHYLKEPYGHHLKTTKNGLIELEVGDVKDHKASRLFHISKNGGVSFVDVNNVNYTLAMITWPLDSKFLINKEPEWDKCVHFKSHGAVQLLLLAGDQLLTKIDNPTNDKEYTHCQPDLINIKSITLTAIGEDSEHSHVIYITTANDEIPFIERIMYYLYSVNYADGFITMFYAYYVIQFILIFSLFFNKGHHDSHWLSISALRHTYSKVWIVFFVTSISFLCMPLFYGSFAKDNLRCSVLEAPFYPFGTRYNSDYIFQFDFLLWATLFLFYENSLIFIGYHVHIFRHQIQHKWIPMVVPGILMYMKYRLLYNMFVWYVYEESSCFNTMWLYYLWNAFGFIQLVVMPVSWIFMRYMHLLLTNKLTLGFRPKDL